MRLNAQILLSLYKICVLRDFEAVKHAPKSPYNISTATTVKPYLIKLSSLSSTLLSFFSPTIFVFQLFHPRTGSSLLDIACEYVPSVAKVLLPRIFSNLHNLGTERGTTKELDMNSIDICSINLIECFFVVSLLCFQVREV